jgi:cobalt-zinc-cadmium efflux system membrane fusion protein
MKANAKIKMIKSKFFKLPSYEQKFILITTILMGVLIFKFLIESLIHVHQNKLESHLIRHDDLIEIPSNSPIKKVLKRLTIQSQLKNQVYSVPGYVETNAKKDIEITTPIPGRIIRIPIKLGDWVQKNQILAEIKSPELADLYSNYDTAVAQLNLTTQLLERAIKVNLAGANAKKDIEIAKNNYLAAKANLKSIKERIKIFGDNQYSTIYIKAPNTGYITQIHLGVGTYINNISTPIMTLNNVKKIWITALIPEYLTNRIKAHQTVHFRLNAEPNHLHTGKISFISPTMDPLTRSNKTRITINNPHNNIKPDMFANVDIFVQQHSPIVVPNSAIFMDYESTSVFLEVKPWTFKRIPVEIGYENNNQVEIISGLKLGDKIAVEGGIFIND